MGVMSGQRKSTFLDNPTLYDVHAVKIGNIAGPLRIAAGVFSNGANVPFALCETEP